MTDVRTSVVPELLDALIAQARAVLEPQGVEVIDGLPAAWTVGDFLYVGVTDPDSPTPTAAATSTQKWPLATPTGRDETGTITCYAYVQRGSADPKEARDAAFGIVGAVQSLLRGPDVRLGVPGVLRTSFASQDFDQGQTADGALAVVTFRIDFTARI